MLTKHLLLSSLLCLALAACSDDDKKTKNMSDDVDAAMDEGDDTEDEDAKSDEDDADGAKTGDAEDDESKDEDDDGAENKDDGEDMDADDEADMDDDGDADDDGAGAAADDDSDEAEPSDTDSDGMSEAPSEPLFAPCQSDDDCSEGYLCYEFGGYCGSACTEDEDCSELGENFSCSGAGFVAPPGNPAGNPGGPGGGPRGGRPFMDAGMEEQSPTGVCRASCDADEEMDEQGCPQGMACVDRGFGSDRCAYVEPEPERPSPASVEAFYECYSDADCSAGLACTVLNEQDAPGYCAELCRRDEDCTLEPDSGSASAACSDRELCVLSCDAEMGGDGSCPDGMQCNALGECFVDEPGSRVRSQ